MKHTVLSKFVVLLHYSRFINKQWLYKIWWGEKLSPADKRVALPITQNAKSVSFLEESIRNTRLILTNLHIHQLWPIKCNLNGVIVLFVLSNELITWISRTINKLVCILANTFQIKKMEIHISFVNENFGLRKDTMVDILKKMTGWINALNLWIVLNC